MLRVGLTGGIGSGKTTVASIFSLLGIPVYFADDEAKKIMQEDPEVKNSMIRLFGAEAYSGDTLNRKFISAQVFNNPEKLQALNAIVHPATIAAAGQWLKNQSTPYAIKEAALVFESGSVAGLDKVIGVFAPVELRVKRTMLRDGITEEKVRERIANQMNEDDKMKLCDFVIMNDEEQLLIPQVLKVHQDLLHLAKSTPDHG